MNIDQAARETFQKSVTENAHESRQHDEIRFSACDCIGQRCVKIGTRGKTRMAHHLSVDAMSRGDSETGRVGLIGDHGTDLRRQARLQQRLHIAAAAGNQDDDALQGLIYARRVCASPRVRARMPPMRRGVSPRELSDCTARSAPAWDTITAMPTPQLNTRNIS